MKSSTVTSLKSFKDSKFSYPKIKRNKSKPGKIHKIDYNQNKENQDPDDFWRDCQK